MLLHFPNLHPEFVPGGPVPGALFFDPGLGGGTGQEADDAAPARFLPEGLPLDADNAKRLLEDCIRFGEQFTTPGEMAYFGVQRQPGGGESASALESELVRRLSGGEKPEQPADAQVSRAQFLLLLAWALEERTLELHSLSKGMEQAWQRFGSTLGVAEEDALDRAELEIDSLVSNMHAPEAGMPALPWQLILEAACVLMPEGGTLVTRDAEIVASMREAGVAFVPAAAGDALPEGADVAEAEAWKLAGMSRRPEKRAALQRVVRLAHVPA